jgi:lambda family phage portal protein
VSAFTVTSDSISALPAVPPPAEGRRRVTRNRRIDAAPAQKYDLAGSGPSDKNHWSRADGLSANAAHSPDVLFRLRSRSRYETENNGYVGGLMRGRANDCIGTGPRLQLRFPDTFTDPDFEREQPVKPGLSKWVENLWKFWCDAIGLTDKLHLIDKSDTREGEVYGVVDTNPYVEPNTPQLDIRLYEADQCGDPSGPIEDNVVNGIRLDDSGRPIAYHFYRQHPGDSMLGGFGMGFLPGDWVPANQVFHFFDPDRVGQAHGVPALVSGLPLGAVMRRYTMASLGAAELQASIPATLEAEHDLPDADDETDNEPSIKDMQQIPFAHTQILVTPAGRTLKSHQATQPAPSYKEFKGEVNTEVGRGINAPRNISTGSSAEYNYSSGRLDHLPWQTAIRIRRDRIRRVLLDRLFRLWLAEAALIPGYLPDGLPPVALWTIRWQWDGFPSIDPVKDATANQIKLETGQTTLDDVCAEDGKDWEEVLEQQAREMKKRQELGLPQPAEVRTPAPTPAPAPPADGEVVDA